MGQCRKCVLIFRSDGHDYLAPRLAQMQNPVSSPNTFPLTTTHLILLLLPPTLFLPLLPAFLLPYLLLPMGYAGPLVFHPNFTPALLALPRHPTVLRARAFLESFCLTDGLPDDIGRQPITRVQVWENERLDPAIAAKPPAGPLAPGSFSSRHLRAAERAPWIKVMEYDSLWKAEGKEERKEGDKMALALQPGWEFVPGEEWRVDVCGLWSEAGTDEGELCRSTSSNQADRRRVVLYRRFMAEQLAHCFDGSGSNGG